ncbi:MAG: hypothetical protein ACI4ED_05140, partial [Suilimivivens sp.]
MSREKDNMKKKERAAAKQAAKAEKKAKAAEKKTVEKKTVEKKTARMKKEKEGQNSIAFFRRIGFRLIVSFLIPVIFIIILGVVSYNKASKQIIESYEISASQTMSMINRYLALAIDTVQSDYKKYMNDETLQKFYKGLLDKDESHSFIPRQYQTDLNTAININDLIDNVYFLSDSQVSITTTQTTETNLLSAYKETPQGQMVNADQYKYFLFGNQCEAD